jgi:hypothetical protein
MNIKNHIEQLELAIAEVRLADSIVTELTEQIRLGKKLYEDCQLMEAEELLHNVGLRVRAVMQDINNN